MKTLPETFKKIIEPTVTAIASRFADRSMMMTKEGQIRLYGHRYYEHEDGTKEMQFIVQKSDDYGVSFYEEPVANDNAGPMVYSPWSGDYLTVLSYVGKEVVFQEGRVSYASEYVASRTSYSHYPHERGVFVIRSKQGPDGPYEEKKIFDDPIHFQRLVLPLKHRKRWILCGQKSMSSISKDLKGYIPVILISDDDGETWRCIQLPEPPVMDQVTYPNRGHRWIHPGVEPVIAELSTGRLMMLLRSSMQSHYQMFSDDGGESWSSAEPTCFYSVATMPGLYSLSQNRLLAVWNNTTPLPELDHEREQTDMKPTVIDGTWEDVFTNRDALHAAISTDDGQTWHGFREIALNEHRNDSDFRTLGSTWIQLDKSIHQNQVLELPDNKVLVHYGQAPSCQRVAIFDLSFLEKRERTGNFFQGIKDWSTQIYYKSFSGGFRIAGHCSWNRRSGAQLVPSPTKDDWKEALLIARHPDSRLFSDIEGAVWNFPATRKGRVTADLTIIPGTEGIRISLVDRWINPCDEYVLEYADFSVILDGRGFLGEVQYGIPGERFTLIMEFDLDKGECIFTSSATPGKVRTGVTRTLPGPLGKTVELSYLHLQTAAKKADNYGVCLHETKMEMK